MSNKTSLDPVCCAACGERLFGGDKAGEILIKVTTKTGGSSALAAPICYVCACKVHSSPEDATAVIRAACPRMLAVVRAA